MSWMTGGFVKMTIESEFRGSVDADDATEGDGLRKKEPKKDDLLVEGAGAGSGGGGAAGSVRIGTEGGRVGSSDGIGIRGGGGGSSSSSSGKSSSSVLSSLLSSATPFSFSSS